VSPRWGFIDWVTILSGGLHPRLCTDAALRLFHCERRRCVESSACALLFNCFDRLRADGFAVENPHLASPGGRGIKRTANTGLGISKEWEVGSGE